MNIKERFIHDVCTKCPVYVFDCKGTNEKITMCATLELWAGRGNEI